MASLCGRIAIYSMRKNVLCSSYRFASKVTLGDPLEHATGLEKRELIAKISGNDNPYVMKALKRGAGTKASPNIIHSAFDARIVGCICEEDSTSVCWMWLHKGEPKRCECGHWFSLEHKAPI